MRIAELFEPQVPTRKRKRGATVPEVFIVESLALADEAGERREGAVLAAVLKMCGKNPLYYYIRTRAELELMAKEFERSGYRYLHISCHGGAKSLELTLDSVGYKDFAQIFRRRLRNRRLFVSACSAGNHHFAAAVSSRNKDLKSIAAPAKDIQFDHAVAFWSSFYVKTFSLNSDSMNADRIVGVLGPLAQLFGEPVHFSRKSGNGRWTHELIAKDAGHLQQHRSRPRGRRTRLSR
jgi:hypothetical protein